MSTLKESAGNPHLSSATAGPFAARQRRHSVLAKCACGRFSGSELSPHHNMIPPLETNFWSARRRSVSEASSTYIPSADASKMPLSRNRVRSTRMLLPPGGEK